MRSLIWLIVFFICLASVSALSCAPTEPKIGIVDKIIEEESRIVVSLKNVSTYDTQNLAKEGTYQLDEYQNIVYKYIQNDFNFGKPVLVDVSPSKISLELDAFKYLSVKQGDIIMQGPPFHVCAYSLYLFLNEKGNLMRTYTRNNFASISYKTDKILISPGNPLEFCRGLYCDIDVKFNINSRVFAALPKEVKFINSPSIYSVMLLDARFHNPKSKVYVEDWGINRYARYLIFFKEGRISEIPAEPTEEMPEPVKILPTPKPRIGFWRAVWERIISWW